MLMYQPPTDSDPVSCPYLDDNIFIQRYTFLKDLTGKDFDFMLEQGWRHFGLYFFIPNCKNCSSCTPIRTLVNRFQPSKSQRKLLNKNRERVIVKISDLEFDETLFKIYSEHSRVKFNQDSSIKEFKESFFTDAISGNSRVVKYYIDSKLAGFGIIDIGDEGLSSVYYCYDPEYSSYSLGTYSALKEIEVAKSLGKKYYYMGYYIKGNRSMEYKSKFTPLEYLDWNDPSWKNFIKERTASLQSIDTLG